MEQAAILNTTTTKNLYRKQANYILVHIYNMCIIYTHIHTTSCKKIKRDQLPGILHTGVCIALEASVEYKLCTPSWTDHTI